MTDSDYGEAHGGDRFRTAVAVCGIVRNDGRVLLMRQAGSGYDDGEFSLPAGHVDGGEDVKTALVRELAEKLTSPSICQLRTLPRSPPAAGTPSAP